MLEASVITINHDGMRDVLAVMLREAPGEAAVLGAVACGLLGGHAGELPHRKEACGVRGIRRPAASAACWLLLMICCAHCVRVCAARVVVLAFLSVLPC